MEGLPFWFLSAVNAALLTGLAVALLALDRRSGAVRAFAALLVLRGVNGVAATLDDGGNVEVARLAVSFDLWMSIPLLFAVVAFVALFPRRRAWATNGFWIALVALLGAVQAAYVFAPDLYGKVAPQPGGGVRIVEQGPLLPMLNVVTTSLVLPAVVLAWDYLRMPEGPARRSTFLVAVGFTSYNAWFGTLFLRGIPYALAGEVPPYSSAETFPIYFGLWALGLLSLVAAAAVALMLALGLRRTTQARERRAGWALVGAFVLLPAATGLVSEGSTLAATAGLGPFFRGLWRLPLPVLVSYALARHRLFDIDFRIKWTIRRGTVAAVFVAVFLVVAEIAQNVLSNELGLVAGGVAAGVLVFAIHPLQRMAERVADAAMPNVRDRADDAASSEVAYRAAVEMALADGVVTRAEEHALGRLAERLRIPPARAVALREELERAVAAPA